MLAKKVSAFIKKNKLFSKNELLLVTVSGGRDSVVLLMILKQLGYQIAVAHCNFGLRDKESDLESVFVENLCRQLNVAFYQKHFDTKKIAKANKESIQMTARTIRYEWFSNLSSEIKSSKIITAHHLDDQIETFLINFSRGTGLKGLTGIPMVRGSIVRPFLSVNRDEINAFVQENKVIYCEDSSNADDKYLRNKIRQNFTPILKEINPSFYNSFYLTNSKLQQVSKFWEKGYEKWIKENVVKSEMVTTIKFQNKESDFGFFEQFLLEHQFSNSDILNCKELNELSIGKKFFSESYLLTMDRKTWVLSKVEQEKNSNVDRIYNLLNDKLPIHLNFSFPLPNSLSNYSNSLIRIDSSKIQGELVVRKWKNGDFFVPFGMTGKKKLSDFFIDQKINSTDKQKIWLLCDEKNIIWLVGLRMDNRYRITPKTNTVIEIELQ